MQGLIGFKGNCLYFTLSTQTLGQLCIILYLELTSIGSTSWAITTNWAFFCSTSLVTVFVPARMKFGFFFGWTSLPFALAAAIFFNRCFLANVDSGRYFSSNLNNCTAVCLSKVWLNWLIGGGIFNRFCKIAFCRWTRIYFGQRTNRERSRFGWIFWPKNELK